METHQSYCDEAWVDRNAVRQEQHTVVSSFWIEFNLQSEGVILPINYKSSFNKPTLVPYIHPFFRALFIFSLNCHFFFLIRLFITHYSSFRRRICLPFKYSFFVTCCPVKFLIQSVVTSLKCSIVSSSVHPSFINHCLSITFLIDIQLASTPLWEAEESCGIYSKEMYLVESCNCICSIKSSEKPLLIRDFS